MSISSDAKIQNAYIALYQAVAKYIWPYEVIEHLVTLEIESFKTFVDYEKLTNAFNAIKRDIRDTSSEDKDMQKALEKFEKILEERPEQFSRLFQVNELI